MPECIICGDYTKFEGGLCLSCYKAEKADNSNHSDKRSKPVENMDIVVNNSGLSDRDRTYRYNMIKGRIAETLIQELFLSLKYNVFRYGMENTIPGIMELLKGIKSEVAEEIKRMPDFVIQNPKTGEVFFVEVKFRASETFAFNNLPKDYAWENAFFILVSKKHIKCINYKELKGGKEITPESQNYLGSRKEFDLDRDTILDFCKFAVQFFKNV